MKTKKIVAAVFSILFIFSLAACGSKESVETVATLPTVETAVQREYSAEEVADIFNQAVTYVEEAQSYNMKGSVNSTAVMGDTMATVVTSVDCDYKNVDGQDVMLMKSTVNNGSSQTEHVTYYADGKYYFELPTYDLKYYTETNDYTDYHAEYYLKKMEAKNLSDIEIRDEIDGSRSIQFSVPYGVYQSEAVSGWLGGYTGENVDSQPITLKAIVGADGKISNFYISFATSMSFGEDLIEQTIILSLTISGYDTTEVVAPSDLDAYMDWNEGETSEGETEGVGMLPPEDVD